MIKEKLINDIEVKNIRLDNQKPYKYDDLLPHPWCNIVICAEKFSGKSVVIYNILKRICTSKTEVNIFCPTVHVDELYLKMVEKLENKYNINVNTFESFIDEKGSDLILNKYNEQVKYYDENKETVNKGKWAYPLYINIFDDIGEFLRSPSLGIIMTKNRHAHVCNIISMHTFFSIQPMSRTNTDILILFGNLNEKVLKDIWLEKCQFIHDFELFKEIYDQATKEKYNFLYVDQKDKELRHNFNKKFIINSS